MGDAVGATRIRLLQPLRTHQSNPILSAALDQAVNALGERRQLRNPVVARLAVDVALRLGAPGAEFPPEKYLTDVRGLQGCLQTLPGEMRKAPVVGTRTYVRHDLDSMALQ